MAVDWKEAGAATVVLGVLGFVGLLLIVSGGRLVKEATEDLVWEEDVPPLHTFKVWEGEFSIDLEGSTLQKYRWEVFDLDDGHVVSGFAATLEQAQLEARDWVATKS